MSRQFSQKFHVIFKQILVKGQVLLFIDYFCWKKEHQARGASHYHVLLWIQDAPAIGIDDNSKVFEWIQDRITCETRCKESNPELQDLVTRYHMHKCRAYCRTKCKRASRSMMYFKLEFPREARVDAIVYREDICGRVFLGSG